MANIICVNCMKGTLDANGVCSACKKADADLETSRRHLTPRTILKGKYLVGKVIGEGGFGITYIGYDLDLEIRVAIKEFCPRDFAARDITDGLTILPFDRDSAEFFQAEKEKFINEAKRLARFRSEPGIVSVQDYFQENGTAYIVMDYIDGITLKSFQSMIGTSMEVEKVLNLMKPVMEGLAKLHENGVIHRDISPDNIMIDTAKEKIYLIDFGTAREVRFQEERSLSVYKKGGYTPIEQQTSHGKQGPWTDVYALCATIYRCITGKSIPEVNNRLVGDELIKPSAMGFAIDTRTEDALLRGLAIKPEERTQNMEQLMKDLYAADSKPQPVRNEYKTAIVKKAPVTEKNTVKKQDIAETVSVTDLYAAKRNFEQKTNTLQTQNNKTNKVSVGILVFVIILVFFSLPSIIEEMSNPSRENFEVHENGLTKYVEYQAENEYTINWKDASGNVVKTEEYQNDQLISRGIYKDSGRTIHYQYETENDYTVTSKNPSGVVVSIVKYQNNQFVSREDYEYETNGDYIVEYANAYGDKCVKRYEDKQLIYEEKGSPKVCYKYNNNQVIEEEIYNHDDTLDKRYKYDNGQLIGLERYFSDGSYQITEYEPEEGKTIYELDRTIYEYDSTGYMTSYKTFIDGKLDKEENYTY